MTHKLLILLLLSLLTPACEQTERTPVQTTASARERVPEPDRQERLAAEAQELAMTATGSATLEDKQLDKLQKRLALQPDNLEVWAQLGQSWTRKARLDQNTRLYAIVEAIADHIISIKSTHPGGLHLKALVAREEHDFAKVRDIAQALTERDAQDVNAWGLLGDAALELGQMDQAITAYQSMMDLYPGIPSYSRVAYVRWLHNDIEGAQEMWTECAKAGSSQEPEPFAYCLAEAGHVEWFRGDLERATLAYNQALSGMPEHAGALLGRGRVQYARGNMDEAIKDLKASLKARRLEETFIWLAAAYRAANQLGEAERMEAQLLAESAHDDPRSISLYLSSSNKEPERALALAERDAKSRSDIYTHDALAMAYWRNGRLADARRHLEHSLALDTPDPRLLAHAGLIFAAAKDTERARPLLERAHKLNAQADPYLSKELAGVHAALTTETP